MLRGMPRPHWVVLCLAARRSSGAAAARWGQGVAAASTPCHRTALSLASPTGRRQAAGRLPLLGELLGRHLTETRKVVANLGLDTRRRTE